MVKPALVLVKALKSFGYEGEIIVAGEYADVTKSEARQLIASGQAVKAIPEEIGMEPG